MTLYERAVAQLQSNLPMLLAAGLAGFTWWLIQASPKDVAKPRPARVPSQADYQLNKATIARFDSQGRLQAVIDGEAMSHYPVNDELRIDRMVLSARDLKGQGLHASAREGYANGLAKEVVIQGGAKAIATPAPGQAKSGGVKQGPVRLMGERFHINTETQVLTSEQPVTMVHSAGEIRAQGLKYDQTRGVTELKGRVVGHYSDAQP